MLIYLFLLMTYCVLWGVSTKLFASVGSLGLWDNPYSWFVPVWIIQAFLLCLPLLDYQTPVSFGTAFYVIGCHAAFICGAFAVPLVRKGGRRSDVSQGRRSFVVPLVLAVGVVAQLALLLDNVASSGIGIFERFGSSQALAAYRDARLSGTIAAGPLGPLFGVMNVVATASLLGLAYLGFSWGVYDRWASRQRPGGLFAVGAVIAICLLSVAISGGRVELVFSVALLGIPYALGRSVVQPFGKSTAKQIKRIAVLTPIALTLFVASAYYQAYRGDQTRPEQALLQTFGAYMPPSIAEANAADRAVGDLVVQAAYLQHSITVLEFFQRYGTAGPFYGRYNFSNEIRPILKLLPNYDKDFWVHDREQLFRTLESQDRNGNVWATIIHDFEADFGFMGSLIGFFVFGVVLQYATMSFYKRPTANRAAFVGTLRLVCLWSAFSSLFFLNSIGYLLFIAVLIEIWLSFIQAFSNKKNVRANGSQVSALRSEVG